MFSQCCRVRPRLPTPIIPYRSHWGSGAGRPCPCHPPKLPPPPLKKPSISFRIGTRSGVGVAVDRKPIWDFTRNFSSPTLRIAASGVAISRRDSCYRRAAVTAAPARTRRREVVFTTDAYFSHVVSLQPLWRQSHPSRSAPTFRYCSARTTQRPNCPPVAAHPCPSSVLCRHPSLLA